MDRNRAEFRSPSARTRVAATRVEDYWHSPPAVLFGMAVGAVCALVGWSAAGSRYVVPRVVAV